MWYCERLKLAAKRPLCLVLLRRPSLKEAIEASLHEPFGVLPPYRPEACRSCLEGTRRMEHEMAENKMAVVENRMGGEEAWRGSESKWGLGK